MKRDAKETKMGHKEDMKGHSETETQRQKPKDSWEQRGPQTQTRA